MLFVLFLALKCCKKLKADDLKCKRTCRQVFESQVFFTAYTVHGVFMCWCLSSFLSAVLQVDLSLLSLLNFITCQLTKSVGWVPGREEPMAWLQGFAIWEVVHLGRLADHSEGPYMDIPGTHPVLCCTRGLVNFCFY